jgi:hypothetical protein
MVDKARVWNIHEIKQKNIGSGKSTNTNCALNTIDSSGLASLTCADTPILPG